MRPCPYCSARRLAGNGTCANCGAPRLDDDHTHGTDSTGPRRDENLGIYPGKIERLDPRRSSNGDAITVSEAIRKGYFEEPHPDVRVRGEPLLRVPLEYGER